MSINRRNQDALDFNRFFNDEVRKICAPLYDVGITSFNYIKFFNDGTRLYLADKSPWMECYLEKNFQDYSANLEFYLPNDDVRYALWSSFKTNDVFDIFYERNIWNGFVIYEKHKDYTEVFDIGADKENTQMSNFYINNIGLLENLIKDYKHKTAHMRDSSDKSRIIVPKQKIITAPFEQRPCAKKENLKNFMDVTRYDRRKLDG